MREPEGIGATGPGGRVLWCDTYQELGSFQGGSSPSSINVAVVRGSVGTAPLPPPYSGGGGVFVWSPTGQEDYGTVIKARSSGYWKRLFSGPLNVKWFGAAGNGTTPDDLAIERAISAAGPNGAIYFPKGTYTITNTITVPSSGWGVFTIHGDGIGGSSTPQSAIKADATLNSALNCESAAVAIRDLAIWCESRATTGISLKDSAGSILERVLVMNAAANGQGIWIKGGCYGISLIECQSYYHTAANCVGLRIGGSGNANRITVIGGKYTQNAGCNIWIQDVYNAAFIEVDCETAPDAQYPQFAPTWHQFYALGCHGLTIDGMYSEQSFGTNVSQIFLSGCTGVTLGGFCIATFATTGSGSQDRGQSILCASNCSGLQINAFSLKRETQYASKGTAIQLIACRGVSLNACYVSGIDTCIDLSAVYGNIDGCSFHNANIAVISKESSMVKICAPYFTSCAVTIRTWRSATDKFPRISVEGIYDGDWLNSNKTVLCSGTAWAALVYYDSGQNPSWNTGWVV